MRILIADRQRRAAEIGITFVADLVDPDALLHALHTRFLRVALDMYPDGSTDGSGTSDTRRFRHPRVYATHHVAATR